MANAEFKKAMKSMKKAWSEEKDKGSGAGVPDGKYAGQIVSAAMVQAKSDGHWMIVVKYTISDGDEEGKELTVFMHCQPERFQWIAEFIRKMGREVPDDPDDLDEVVTDIGDCGATVVLTVKTKGEYQNIYLDRLLEEGDATEESEESEEEVEEEETEEEVEDGEEEVEVEVGSRIVFKDPENAKKKITGEIIKIDEKTGVIVVEDEEFEYDITAAEILEVLPVEEEEEEAEEEEEEEAEEETEDNTALLEIAAAHDIEVEDDAERATIVKKLKKHAWDGAELTKEERETLAEVGIKVAAPAAKKKSSPPQKPIQKGAKKTGKTVRRK